MEFEARPMRVQLPCKSVTIIDAEDDGVQLQVHRYWDVMTMALGKGLDLGDAMCDDCSANPSEPLCNNGSEELNIFAELDYRVLPILRLQLEARLREIKQAEDAIAQAGRNG